ncbi:glycosyltransferase [Halobellus sp. GM3]|uniref:glycosyltransferase n=1 Tax=Halobellus sp. GM3 TaxID=3458410 RepID=UPI00403E0BC3
MDDLQVDQRFGERGQETDPAIGVDAVSSTADGDAIVQTATDLSRYGTDVFVALPSEAVGLKRRLERVDVTLVEVATQADDSIRELAKAGKQRGLPGIILHPSPDSTREFDFEESVATFQTSEQYVVDGHVRDSTLTTGRIAALIASEHSQTALHRLRDELQQYVDGLLILDDTEGLQSAEWTGDAFTEIESIGSGESGIYSGLAHVTRLYAGGDEIVLVGPDTTAEALTAVPDMIEQVCIGDADLVIGRRMTEAAGSSDKRGELSEVLRGAFGLDDSSRSGAELETGVQVLTLRVARELERQLDQAATRLNVIDTVIRSDLNVSIHEYALEDAASTEHSDIHPEDRVLLGRDSDVRPTVSVVMPTMNEEEGIRECIERVKRAVTRSGYQTEVLISDDSDDRTPDIARELGAIVVEPDQPGYGYAYRYAFEHCRGDYIIIGDADTTYDFEQFPTLLEPVVDGKADMVMGSRLEGEIKDGAMPALHQYVGNPALTRFLNVFYDAGVSDAHSGFRAFRAGMLDDLNLETNGMEFASEMIMDAGARDLTIEEIPITYHEREGEATLESFRDGWRHVRFMLLNAPGYLFTIPGMVMGAVGVLVMLAAFTDVSAGGLTFGIHTAIAGSLLTLVGYQVANMGAFATAASDPIQRSEDFITTTIIERLTLERMATVGVAVCLAGVTYAAWLVVQWANTGFTALPMVVGDVLAFTAIVIGLQTVFNAFLISAVSSDP